MLRKMVSVNCFTSRMPSGWRYSSKRVRYSEM